MEKKRTRCPNGTRRDKKTNECVPKKGKVVNKVKSPPKPDNEIDGKMPRCPNGMRRDKKTNECVPKKGKVVNKVKSPPKPDNEIDGKALLYLDPLLDHLNDKAKLQLLSTMKHDIPMNHIRKLLKVQHDMKIVKDVLYDTYVKMEKKEMGRKPKFTYREMLWVYLIHNPGPQSFENIIGKHFGGLSMTEAIKLCLEDNTIVRIKNPKSKALYKGHFYEMSHNYQEIVKTKYVKIKSDELYINYYSKYGHLGY